MTQMLPVWVVYSIYFELYLPSVSTSATSDPIDVLMYALGMAVFGYFINRNDAVGLTETNFKQL